LNLSKSKFIKKSVLQKDGRDMMALTT